MGVSRRFDRALCQCGYRFAQPEPLAQAPRCITAFAEPGLIVFATLRFWKAGDQAATSLHSQQRHPSNAMLRTVAEPSPTAASALTGMIASPAR